MRPANPRSGLSEAQIAAMWTPLADETVLWQGRPDALVMARSAFRARWVAGYFVLLAGWALVADGLAGGLSGALVTLLAGVVVLAIIHGLALLAARTTRYILTDRRVILHIGMAIEKTINLPLEKIGAAHLADKGGGFGEIALEPAGEHTLGYLLLWPHARPWHLGRPQPMLRALPQAAMVAETLAAAVAAHKAIARGEDTSAEAGEGALAPSSQAGQPAFHGAAA